MKTIAFFNNKGGVGTTTLTYHVAWMFNRLGARVLVADLDPQANLTSTFLHHSALERHWDAIPPESVFGALQPLIDRLGDFAEPHIDRVDGIGIIPGDLALSTLEDRFALAWAACFDDDAATAADAFRVMSSFYRLVASGADRIKADVVLIDVGPSLGALNRAALVAADCVVIPLATRLSPLRALRSLGPVLREWRAGWQKRLERGRVPADLRLPSGLMDPIGYVVLHHAATMVFEPARAYSRWSDRFPDEFRKSVLGNSEPASSDEQRIATVRHFRGLLPMALEARKPVFELTVADGAIGSNAPTVNDAWVSFAALTREIARRAGIVLPQS